MRLAVHIYNGLINCKDYFLKDQIQRSALSISSNIAEDSREIQIKSYQVFCIYPKAPALN